MSDRIATTRATVTSRPFGALPDGRLVELYTIRTGALDIDAITYGGIITSLRMRDRDGNPGDVVLGHGSLEPYLHNAPYLGAIVGRYANRIAGGRFQLDGVAYQLAANDGLNHLHGGVYGFDRQLWTATPIDSPDGTGVRFARISPAGEERYPGTLQVEVSYVAISPDTIELRYEAATDAPTLVNLTQHTYFNLAGETSAGVLDHELTIHADRYTPVRGDLIPTGERAGVEGTPFDFRTPARIGVRLQAQDDQLRAAGGFDHNYVLSRGNSGLARAATLRDPLSGRMLELHTTEPGLQFYSGHLLDGRSIGAYGRVLGPYAGLCLETQHFPDSPNQPSFPPVTLRPGERYRSRTSWRFTAA